MNFILFVLETRGVHNLTGRFCNDDLVDVDHLVFAVPDLAEGVRQIRLKLGTEPGPGGSHPGWGTHNALLSLGEGTYLEVIAPNPVQEVEELPFGVTSLMGARLATWATRSSELEAVVERARHIGVDLGEVRSLQRVRPDGSVLSWKLTDPFAPRNRGLIPFFIDWGDSPHPSRLAPGGCLLRGFSVECPDAVVLRSLYEILGIEIPVRPGSTDRLIALIESPNGLVELS